MTLEIRFQSNGFLVIDTYLITSIVNPEDTLKDIKKKVTLK